MFATKKLTAGGRIAGPRMEGAPYQFSYRRLSVQKFWIRNNAERTVGKGELRIFRSF